MSSRLSIVLSDDLRTALNRVTEESDQSTAETLSKALMLYLTARESTRSGERKLGFYNARTLEIDGEIVGL